MTILEIILLVLLIASLVANFRLWQFLQSYKQAYRNAVANADYRPGIIHSISQLAPIVGLLIFGYVAYKKIKQDEAFLEIELKNLTKK